MKKATVSDLTPKVARLRVPLGFALAVAVFLLARPTRTSLLAGAAVAVAGEAVRFWAAGHLEKGREVTSSGPYRWTRHPLYVGSAIIGVGLMIACGSWVVAAIIAAYLGVTLVAAVRTEERELRAKFGDAYEAYCRGATVRRAFSPARALRNREHRAVGGLALGLLLLWGRMRLWP